MSEVSDWDRRGSFWNVCWLSNGYQPRQTGARACLEEGSLYGESRSEIGGLGPLPEMAVCHSPTNHGTGCNDSFHAESDLRRQSSSTSLHSTANPCGFSAGIVMNASRVHAMRRSINDNTNAIFSLLLKSKEPADKRAQIESALRSCKEAFFELSTVYLCLLEEKKSNLLPLDAFKSILDQAFAQHGVESQCVCSTVDCADLPRSYASVTRSAARDIKVARGPLVAVKKSMNIIVRPKKDTQDKFVSSNDTMATFRRIIRPAEYNLKVNGMRAMHNNKGVRIEAMTGDITRIKESSELEKAGLEVKQIEKMKPRIILHDVPLNMTKEEIKSDIIALNLDQLKDTDVDVVYTFPPKKERDVVSCVVEVSPQIRAKLLGNSHVYINYSACRLEDYVRVLQCYKCLAFGHISKQCTASALCGHCAGPHEMRTCQRKSNVAACGNCKRWRQEELAHSALDGKNCPILLKKIQDKIKNINYG